MSDDAISFEGHPLHPGEGVPIFISAGILKHPAQVEPFLEITDPLAAPALTLGSFTWDRWAGNGEPNFTISDDKQIAGNAVGLENPGREGILGLRYGITQLNALGIKTIVSVTNLPHEAAIDFVPRLAYYVASHTEATAIEVNLGCPNGKMPDGSLHPPLANDVDASIELLEETREVVGSDVVLGIKDSPHVSGLNEPMDTGTIHRLSTALAPLIDFVTGINTIGNQEFPAITVTNGRGGMSGPVVAPVAREHIAAWRHSAPDVPYLSVGGVDSKNANTEIPERLAMPNVIRVGGAQEFYRTKQPHLLAADWAIAAS